MLHKVLAAITLCWALLISAIAAYFSIFGLADLFSAAFYSVIVMGIALEGSKLIVAAWLHANWTNKLVKWWHKIYLCIALITVMAITSLGIFGYLSKAHIDQVQPIQGEIIKQQSLKTQIEIKREQVLTLTKLANDLNTQIASQPNNKSLSRERTRIQNELSKTQKQLDQLLKQQMDSKQHTAQTNVKLGPVLYLADLIFGDAENNIDKAVRIFIVMIMIAFDPLAIALTIAGLISLQTKQTHKIKEDIFTSSEKIQNAKIEKQAQRKTKEEFAEQQKTTDTDSVNSLPSGWL